MLNILSHLIVAATIVLSSTAGAAERQGARLGEFVEAGEHGGRFYYRQRDTEGSQPLYLYFEDNCWQVSVTLGNRKDYIKNCQNTQLLPTRNWEYVKDGRWSDDDTSLTLEFTTLSPCKLIRVVGEGEVVEKQESLLGDYRSVCISVLNVKQSQVSSSKGIHTDYTLQQVGGRKVERGPAGLQESLWRAEVSTREGRKCCLDHQKLHNWHWRRLDIKWKGDKLPFIT